MRLTDDEKILIARRAGGEYAVNVPVTAIWRKHNRKNRSPDDKIYLDFMRVIHKKSHTWEEYEKVVRPVIEAHPDPLGMDAYRRAREAKAAKQDQPRRRKRQAKKKKKESTPEPPPPKPDPETGFVVDSEGFTWLPADWDPTA
jgi:hypothetical protein